MLFSMTGFGSARIAEADADFDVGVEVRSVNNRHLKLTVRGSDPYPLMEAELEKVVRRTIRRGTLLLHIRVNRRRQPGDTSLNRSVLTAYLEQLRSFCTEAGTPELLPHLMSGVSALPGVVPEAGNGNAGTPPDEEWPTVVRTLEAALARLDAARRDEGRAMTEELLQQHRYLQNQLERIRGLIPNVVAGYRARLLDRIRQAVSEAGVAVEADQLIREVAIFADRTDVTEEVSRLNAHLDQFQELIQSGADGAGRRLEFVAQEIGREVNTLGSKAGDVAISKHVVEMKATLEKIRELIQNIE